MEDVDPRMFCAFFGLLVRYMAREFCLYSPRFDHGHPDTVLKKLLTRRLGDGVEGEPRSRSKYS